METTIKVASILGAEIRPYIEPLANLRIAIFKEWPYLYQGSLKYERVYLEKYARCPDSIVALAIAKEQIVGASTALPLVAAENDFRDAFQGSGYSADEVLYLGESVLQPQYRGLGMGHHFFDAREAHARSLGLRYSAFCAVDRARNDPRRPANARTLEPFWIQRGYVRHPEIKTTFDWREVGQTLESSNSLTFWIKEI
ncbi:MAG: hypothetical protein ABS34_04495 [Opitutaceae bacterium BACL24 MAG-120322-bin51]|jgi:GNAT superfamily N-acetyltransferase|nr:MAG: hypothetical protein ABS34_04495 [Opitutaceae bacterium BACL24 MAG-120322-bin51]